MNDTKSESKVETFALSLGMVDYSGRGRNLNRVAVTVELRHKVNTVAPYLDVDLNPCREYVELSMTGEIWNAAGTDCASCGQNLEEIGKLFPDKRAVQRLVGKSGGSFRIDSTLGRGTTVTFTLPIAHS